MTKKNTPSAECLAWIEEQEAEFMQPQVAWLDADEAREFCPDEDAEEESETYLPAAGWYGRLSAPGYMDCTDWAGPFESEAEAWEGLFSCWGE
jgi:hypothetical protein